MRHCNPFRAVVSGVASAAIGAALLVAPLTAAAKPDEITVAYFLQWPTANQIAQVNEWYEEEMGVELNWRSFANGNEMSAAMASGDAADRLLAGPRAVGRCREQGPAAGPGRCGGVLRQERPVRRPREPGHHP
ncbi:MAG: hypothetical protein U5K43_01490 [Halofilum sp. (in: g-proteobacteria)]|nr:hypothetical protein [Halofilum sp. (in: g-proteobacteria)]